MKLEIDGTPKEIAEFLMEAGARPESITDVVDERLKKISADLAEEISHSHSEFP